MGCDCGGLFDRGVVSRVDVPASVDELEAWAEELGLTAEVAPLERESGHFACGHSAACLLLIPIIAVDAVMPPMVQQGSVTDTEGRVIYAGVFDRRGRLLRARVLEGDVYRDIERLDLSALGEHPIVERARVQPGTEATSTSTPIRPQFDFVARYDAALRDEEDGGDRADLVIEELLVFGDEAVPSAQARFSGLDTPDDEELGPVMTRACRSPGPTLPMRAWLVDYAIEHGGEQAAVATVPCVTSDDDGDAARAARLVERVSRVACSSVHPDDAMRALAQLARTQREATLGAVATCEPEARRTIIRLHVGARPSDDEILRAMRDGADRSRIVSALDVSAPADRALLVRGLEGGPTDAIARRLSRGTTGSPSADEAREAARLYAGDLAWVGGVKRGDARYFLLAWLERSDGDAREAAVSALRAATGEFAPGREAALLMLAGERDRFRAALAGVDPNQIRALSADAGFNEDTVIAYALTRAGCTVDEVREGARAARASRAPEPCRDWSTNP